MTIDWPVDLNLESSNYSQDEKIKIRVTLLPEEFRKRDGDGRKAEATKRFIDRNEGFIIRNNREVFYGIPFWPQGGVSFQEGRTPWVDGGDVKFLSLRFMMILSK